MSNAIQWLGRNFSLGGLLRNAGSGIGTVTKYTIKGAGSAAALLTDDRDQKERIRSAFDTAGEVADSTLTRGTEAAGAAINFAVQKASAGVGYATGGAARIIGMSEDNVEFAEKLGTVVGAVAVGAIAGGGIGDAAVALGAIAGTAGAAATTSGFAALGGGAVAAGGGGMAAGISVVQGIAAIGGASGLTTLATRNDGLGDTQELRRYAAEPNLAKPIESATVRVVSHKPSSNSAAFWPIFLLMVVVAVVAVIAFFVESEGSLLWKAPIAAGDTRATSESINLAPARPVKAESITSPEAQGVERPVEALVGLNAPSGESSHVVLDSTQLGLPAVPSLQNSERPTDFSESGLPAPIDAPVTLTRAEIQRIQSILAQLGYSPGGADGKLGARTRAAIECFERDLGLHATGIANAKLLSVLELTSAERGERYSECLKRVSSDADFRACGSNPPPCH